MQAISEATTAGVNVDEGNPQQVLWGKFAFSVALSRRERWRQILRQICFFRRFIYDKYHPEVPFFTFRCKPFLKPLQQESMLTKAIHNRYCEANLLFPSLYLEEKGEDKFWGKFAFSVALSTISTTQKCHSLLLDASHFWSHYSRSQCWRRQSTTGIVRQICFFRRFIYDNYHPEVLHDCKIHV